MDDNTYVEKLYEDLLEEHNDLLERYKILSERLDDISFEEDFSEIGKFEIGTIIKKMENGFLYALCNSYINDDEVSKLQDLIRDYGFIKIENKFIELYEDNKKQKENE